MTHSLAGGAVFTAAGLLAGALVGVWWVPVALAAGWVAAIVGDMCTPHGCPLLWPRPGCLHLLPAGWRVVTGGAVELLGVGPVLWAGCAVAGLVVAGGWGARVSPTLGVAAVVAAWSAGVVRGWRGWSRHARGRRAGG